MEPLCVSVVVEEVLMQEVLERCSCVMSTSLVVEEVLILERHSCLIRATPCCPVKAGPTSRAQCSDLGFGVQGWGVGAMISNVLWLQAVVFKLGREH